MELGRKRFHDHVDDDDQQNGDVDARDQIKTASTINLVGSRDVRALVVAAVVSMGGVPNV